MRAPRPKTRLAILVAALVVAYVSFWLLDLVSVDQVRDWVGGFGVLAPLAYVPIAAALGVALVPGALLATVAGLLFGAGVGLMVTLAASVGSAVTSVLIARRTEAQELGGRRVDRVRGAMGRHGTMAVAAQRLMPGVPDGPLNYVFGLLGVTLGQIALGTLVGAAPRAFSYTAIGASIDDPASPLALAGYAGLVLTGIVGAVLAHRAYRRSRTGSLES